MCASICPCMAKCVNVCLNMSFCGWLCWCVAVLNVLLDQFVLLPYWLTWDRPSKTAGANRVSDLHPTPPIVWHSFNTISWSNCKKGAVQWQLITGYLVECPFITITSALLPFWPKWVGNFSYPWKHSVAVSESQSTLLSRPITACPELTLLVSAESWQ